MCWIYVERQLSFIFPPVAYVLYLDRFLAPCMLRRMTWSRCHPKKLGVVELSA